MQPCRIFWIVNRVAHTFPKLTDYSANGLLKAFADTKLAFRDELREVKSEAEWKVFRDLWIARKNGVLTKINDQFKKAPKESKREFGQHLNELKQYVESEIDGWHKSSEDGTARLAVQSESVDISLPGVRRPIGAEHPVVKTTNEMVRVFQKLGYSVADGPVVETDYYNFEALNFPPNHPARDTQDTLFIAGQQSTAAGAVAAAHAYFSGADSDDGKDAPADSHCDSWNRAPQRSSGCEPFADVSSD